MITEYHPGGTLAQRRGLFSGKPIAALEAFRPLVRAVATLHESSPRVVHRDIKPENIFVASDGRLVLGDFGIVFFEDPGHTRLTGSTERVGSHEWMAPWVYARKRVEEVPSSSDVFCLGKVLWSMLTGQPMLPFWYHRRPEYDLEHIFSADSGQMRVINSLLDRCVVEEEKSCLPNAKELLIRVDECIRVLRLGGHVLGEGLARACRICGKGIYQPLTGREAENRFLFLVDKKLVEQGRAFSASAAASGQAFWIRAFECSECGHTELFHFPDGRHPGAWLPAKDGKSSA